MIGRWPRWLAWTPWARRQAARDAALAAADAAQRAAQAAARRAIIDAAHGNPARTWRPMDDPMWRVHRNRR